MMTANGKAADEVHLPPGARVPSLTRNMTKPSGAPDTAMPPR
jgi:hypothetical protein